MVSAVPDYRVVAAEAGVWRRLATIPTSAGQAARNTECEFRGGGRGRCPVVLGPSGSCQSLVSTPAMCAVPLASHAWQLQA
jgi:hypothetical protein